MRERERELNFAELYAYDKKNNYETVGFITTFCTDLASNYNCLITEITVINCKVRRHTSRRTKIFLLIEH